MAQFRLACCTAALVSVVFSFSAPQAESVPPRTLDYSKTTTRDSMVYIPYEGLGKRGPVFFTKYQEELSATATVLDLRRIFVNLVPVAFRDGSYTAFVNELGIIDDRVLPIPEWGLCQPTKAIQDLLKGMPDGYKPSMAAGNWPFTCTLSVWFLPSDEALVRSTIIASHGMAMSASVPLCAPDSPRVKTAQIVQNLVARGTAQATAAGDVTGNLFDLLYATVVVAMDSPSLFATADPLDGWRALMARVVVDSGTKTLTVPSHVANNDFYVCNPSPLAISY